MNQTVPTPIVIAGDVWRILSTGAVSEGSTFCHLASLERGHVKKNKWIPLKIFTWLDSAVVLNSKQPQKTQPNT